MLCGILSHPRLKFFPRYAILLWIFFITVACHAVKRKTASLKVNCPYLHVVLCSIIFYCIVLYFWLLLRDGKIIVLTIWNFLHVVLYQLECILKKYSKYFLFFFYKASSQIIWNKLLQCVFCLWWKWKSLKLFSQ